MKCHIGIMSEFTDAFTERVFNAISEYYGDGVIRGAADIETQEAWVFIDNIVNSGESFEKLMKSIVGTTIHELVHLCGYVDEAVAMHGEELLAWEE